jgi:hypothetical protein
MMTAGRKRPFPPLYFPARAKFNANGRPNSCSSLRLSGQHGRPNHQSPITNVPA